jgi:large subunit ribosomal protein L21
MYAIIETGNKQYKVAEGDIITVEKLTADEGAQYTFENVLAICDGDKVNFGTPVVSGATVTASVLGNGKAKKVIVYKYKSKKGFHKKNGHRQPFTKLKIEKING